MDKKSINRIIFDNIIKHKLSLFIILFLTAIDILSGLLGTVFVQQFTDKVLIGKQISALPLLLTFLLITGIAGSVTRIFKNPISSSVNCNIVYSNRTKLFDHIFKIPFINIEKWKTGELINRLDNCNILSRVSIEFITDVFTEIFTLSFILIYILILNWKLAIICILGALFSSFMQYKSSKHAYYYSGKIMEKEGELASHTVDTLGNIAIIKLWNAASQISKKAQKIQHEITQLTVKNQERMGITSCIGQISFEIAIVLVYAYGAFQVIKGDLTVGGYVVFTSYMGWLNHLFSSGWDTFKKYIQSRAGIERIIEISMIDIEKNYETSYESNVQSVTNNLLCKNLYFRYNNEIEFSLSSINFNIRKGSTLGIVGSSGAGKSTILKILSGLYEISPDQIFIDKFDLAKMPLEWKSKRISYVPQDIRLLAGTLKENVLLANPNATDAEIYNAFQISDIYKFVKSLPDDINTYVGDGGIEFSSGQRQKIAIAQCILRNAEIVLLDEATSALDEISQRKIINNLRLWASNRILIMVAHRLNVVSEFDEILVLSSGSVTERGKHTDLVNSNGLYSRLWSEQKINSNII